MVADTQVVLGTLTRGVWQELLNAIIERYEVFQPDPDWIHLMENQTNIEVCPPTFVAHIFLGKWFEKVNSHTNSSSHGSPLRIITTI